MSGRGHIRRRGPDRWAVVVELEKDPVTGKRRQMWKTVQGTRRDAQAVLTKLLAEAQDGHGAPTRLTTGDLFDRFLRDHATPNLSRSSYTQHERNIRLYLRPRLGSIPLASLSPLQIQEYYAWARREGGAKHGQPLSAGTVRLHHQLLSRALALAVRWGLIPRSPLDRVDAPAIPRVIPRGLDLAAAGDLLRAAQDHYLYIPILLAMSAGLRAGELVGLRWEDVDLERGLLTVRRQLQLVRQRPGEWTLEQTPTKSGRSRPVKLPAFVVDELRAQAATHADRARTWGAAWHAGGWVCPRHDGTAQSPAALSNLWYYYREKFGTAFATVRLHDLRHTMGNLAAAAGIHPKAVAERLGHSSVNLTLNRYSHLFPSMQDEAAAILDAALRRALDLAP